MSEFFPYSLHLHEIAHRENNGGTDPCDRACIADSGITEPDWERECRDDSCDKFGGGADHRNGSASKSLTACAEEEYHAKRNEEPDDNAEIDNCIVNE